MIITIAILSIFILYLIVRLAFVKNTRDLLEYTVKNLQAEVRYAEVRKEHIAENIKRHRVINAIIVKQMVSYRDELYEQGVTKAVYHLDILISQMPHAFLQSGDKTTKAYKKEYRSLLKAIYFADSQDIPFNLEEVP